MHDYEVPVRIFVCGIGCLFVCVALGSTDWRVLAAGLLGTVAGGTMIYIAAKRKNAAQRQRDEWERPGDAGSANPDGQSESN
jgi:hypothetical protein